MSFTTAPASIEDFELRLKEAASTLPKRMRQCANHIAANLDRVAVSTVAELASGAGVPPSAMIRFCQALGFGGYSDMQRLFRNAYSANLPDYTTRLTKLRESGVDSPSVLLAEFADAGRISLENLLLSIDSRALDQAVEVLSRADTVHVVGLRRAYPVASYLIYMFDKMHIPAMLHHGIGKLDQRHAIRAGDALVAITFMPYSQETVELTDYVLSKNLPVVAITDTVTSPLQISSTHVLSVKEVDFGSFRSLSATLSLGVALAVAVGARRKAS